MSEPAIEKREHPRYEVNAVVGIGDQAGQRHKVRNISLGGISIESPEVQEVGEELQLVIRFPDLDGAELQVRGKVVWVNREPPTDMGIRFVDLDEARRETLREFLRRVVVAEVKSLPRQE